MSNWPEPSGLTAAAAKRLEDSIQYAQEQLNKGLFLPEDAAQLRRMIAYYEEKLEAYRFEQAMDEHANQPGCTRPCNMECQEDRTCPYEE